MTMPDSPHDHVVTRLGRSNIHGIGVFAITDIAAGTDIFPNDSVEIVWGPRSMTVSSDLSEEQKKLYHDFGIIRGDVLGVPRNFNCLTPGWYVNQPIAGDQPNVWMTVEFAVRASRNILSGEELTADYSLFSATALPLKTEDHSEPGHKG
jgi:hypothetical protein